MSLLKCPECGSQISSTAQTCPSCGYQLKLGKVKIYGFSNQIVLFGGLTIFANDKKMGVVPVNGTMEFDITENTYITATCCRNTAIKIIPAKPGQTTVIKYKFEYFTKRIVPYVTYSQHNEEN